jgi:cold shock CspA family protein
MNGRISHWNAPRGWGFVVDQASGDTFFAHVSRFRPHTLSDELRKGLYVTFDIGPSTKPGNHQVQAVDIHLAGDDDDDEDDRREHITTLGGEF